MAKKIDSSESEYDSEFEEPQPVKNKQKTKGTTATKKTTEKRKRNEILSSESDSDEVLSKQVRRGDQKREKLETRPERKSQRSSLRNNVVDEEPPAHKKRSIERTSSRRSSTSTSISSKRSSSRRIAEEEEQQKSLRRSRRNDDDDNLILDSVVFYDLLAEIAKHKDSWPFDRPVNKFEVPDYYDVIRTPMDFAKIKSKLNLGSYRTTYDILNDIQLIFSNCDLYNTDGSDIFRYGWIFFILSNNQQFLFFFFNLPQFQSWC